MSNYFRNISICVFAGAEIIPLGRRRRRSSVFQGWKWLLCYTVDIDVCMYVRSICTEIMAFLFNVYTYVRIGSSYKIKLSSYPIILKYISSAYRPYPNLWPISFQQYRNLLLICERYMNFVFA